VLGEGVKSMPTFRKFAIVASNSNEMEPLKTNYNNDDETGRFNEMGIDEKKPRVESPIMQNNNTVENFETEHVLAMVR
jgi:hypothetical protein